MAVYGDKLKQAHIKASGDYWVNCHHGENEYDRGSKRKRTESKIRCGETAKQTRDDRVNVGGTQGLG